MSIVKSRSDQASPSYGCTTSYQIGSKRNNDEQSKPPPNLFGWKETKTKTKPASHKLPGRNQDASTSLSKRLNPSVLSSPYSKTPHVMVSSEEDTHTLCLHEPTAEHPKSRPISTNNPFQTRPWVYLGAEPLTPESEQILTSGGHNPSLLQLHENLEQHGISRTVSPSAHSLPPSPISSPALSESQPSLSAFDLNVAVTFCPSPNSFTMVNDAILEDTTHQPKLGSILNNIGPPSSTLSLLKPQSVSPSQSPVPSMKQVLSPPAMGVSGHESPSVSSLSSIDSRSDNHFTRETYPPTSPHSSPTELSPSPSSSREPSPPEKITKKRRNEGQGSRRKRIKEEIIVKKELNESLVEDFHCEQYAQRRVANNTNTSTTVSKESTPMELDNYTPEDTEDQAWQEPLMPKSVQKLQKKRRVRRKLTDITLPKISGGHKPMPQGVPRLHITSNEMERQPVPFIPYCTWLEEDMTVDNLVHSFDVVRNISEKIKYETYFTTNDENHLYDIDKYPFIELEFPSSSTQEKFLLTEPKDKDLYNPLFDIEDTVKTMIKFYVPDELKYKLFGVSGDEDFDIPDDSDNYGNNKLLTRLRSLPPSRSVSPLPSSASQPVSDTGVTVSSDQESNNAFQRFVRARRDRDGPAFRKELGYINACFRWLKNSPAGNFMLEAPRKWSNTGIPPKVVERIMDETYQRSVGPRIPEVRKYAAFSSLTYGELLFKFVDEIVQKTGVRSNSLFLDLGSGVGNVVMQVALQTGCTAYGIEVQEVAASIAVEQLEQVRQRSRLWGLNMGEVELENGDITRSPRLSQLMRQADVVLINNYIFAEELNEAIKPLFLDLKDGAKVVSLKPFAEANDALLTDRNVHDHASIFYIEEHTFGEGTVSWTATSGSYYIQTVARDKYAKSLELWEQAKAKRAATGRRSRKIASREQSESAG